MTMKEKKGPIMFVLLAAVDLCDMQKCITQS